MITCVYIISNPINSRVYIGSAANFRVRVKKHLLELRKNKHCNKKLQRFVNKYGIDKLSFSVVEESTKDDLIKREQHYIDLHNCVKKGFNILPTAGTWLHNKHTNKSKKKQSEWRKGRQTSLGRILSEETKDKIRQKAIGRKQSIESVMKRVSKNTGKTRPASAKETVRAKLSKLTDPQIIDIKMLLRMGETQDNIAKKHGVCQRNISRINQGISYSHIKLENILL